jgi:hypothetical protein
MAVGVAMPMMAIRQEKVLVDAVDGERPRAEAEARKNALEAVPPGVFALGPPLLAPLPRVILGLLGGGPQTLNGEARDVGLDLGDPESPEKPVRRRRSTRGGGNRTKARAVWWGRQCTW